MTSIMRTNSVKLLLVMLSIGLGIATLVGCDKSKQTTDTSTSSPPPSPDSLPTFGNTPHKLSLPKVPFGNQPCQSLSAGDRQSLGLSTTQPGKADRAPAKLPFDNLCFYGAIHIGYMTQVDYNFNQSGNRSSSHTAPADLPNAFYDQQGGLWFAKNGYYLVISGSHALNEKIARIIIAKL